MKTGPAVAEILKREGVEYLFAYPVNHLIEHCAALDIRPIIVRQERIGLHMADAMSRLTKGRKMGVFCMQSGPGSENAYGGVAQAYGESVPLLVIPQGYPRRLAHVPPNFNTTIAMAHVAKHCEPVTSGKEIVNIMRRAFSLLRNGRGAPVIVELPGDAPSNGKGSKIQRLLDGRLEDNDLRVLFERLNETVILNVLGTVLLERKLVFVSQNLA